MKPVDLEVWSAEEMPGAMTEGVFKDSLEGLVRTPFPLIGSQ